MEQLKRLSRYEVDTIEKALQLLVQSPEDLRAQKFAANIMLEDDGQFIKSLFWSK